MIVAIGITAGIMLLGLIAQILLLQLGFKLYTEWMKEKAMRARQKGEG